MRRWHAYMIGIREYEIVEMTNGTVIIANIGRRLPGVMLYASLAQAKEEFKGCHWVPLDDTPDGAGEPKGESDNG